jgi:hypothetical protein
MEKLDWGDGQVVAPIGICTRCPLSRRERAGTEAQPWSVRAVGPSQHQ